MGRSVSAPWILVETFFVTLGSVAGLRWLRVITVFLSLLHVQVI